MAEIKLYERKAQKFKISKNGIGREPAKFLFELYRTEDIKINQFN